MSFHLGSPLTNKSHFNFVSAQKELFEKASSYIQVSEQMLSKLLYKTVGDFVASASIALNQFFNIIDMYDKIGSAVIAFSLML